MSTKGKIAIVPVKLANKKVVLAPGTYDLLHYGHLRYLQEAKKLGDVLVVAVSADHVVDKGVNRPVFPIQQRAEMLAELECVDYVIINNERDCSSIIQHIAPNILVKGEELKYKSTDKLSREIEAMEQVGGQVIFLPTQHSSSSMLINDYLCNLPTETCKYLQNLKKQYSFEQIKSYVDRLSNIDVTLIGETIIDEYIYGETIGKSSKNPTLVMMTEKYHKFAGGAVSIANDISQVCNSVRLITYLGDDIESNDSKFIESKLAPNVKMFALGKKDSPTIRKTRFIDDYYKSRLFETNTINPSPVDYREYLEFLEGNGDEDDAIIIADFGHGLMTPKMIKHIYDHYPHLYINVQCNSANFGYNFIDKYNQPNRYVSIDTLELRLLAREKHGDIDKIIRKSKPFRFAPEILSVTEGKQGARLYQFYESPDPIAMYQCPAMCNSTIDSIGAGDSYFSITSLLLMVDTPLELVPFIGNIAAAIKCQILGNDKCITKANLLRNIETLLK